MFHACATRFNMTEIWKILHIFLELNKALARGDQQKLTKIHWKGRSAELKACRNLQISNGKSFIPKYWLQL